MATALIRVEQGNLSNSKSLSGGIFELRVDFGPGYRVYFGKDGPQVIILLSGGSKKRQALDIAQSKKHWKEYKQRKKLR